jgi:flagellar hook-basal body complex protein FliE
MSRIDTQNFMTLRAQVLERNSALAQAAKLGETKPAADFGDVFGQALKRTSLEQEKASALSEAYERGATHDIAAVMIQRQKAALAFETTLQVRNKLVSAYKEIMNMPL